MTLLTARLAAEVKPHFDPQEFFTPAEIARRLKLAPKTVRRRLRDMPGVYSVTVGKRETIRIPGSVVNEHIRQHSRGFVLKTRRRSI